MSQLFPLNAVFERHVRVTKHFRVVENVDIGTTLDVVGATTLTDTTINGNLHVNGKINNLKPVFNIYNQTITLTTAQSGTTFYVSQGATSTINLPSNPVIGTYYKFVFGGGAGAQNIVLNATSANFNGVWSHASYSTLINNDICTVNGGNTDLVGDFITVEAITTSIWHTFACSVNDLTYTFT